MFEGCGGCCLAVILIPLLCVAVAACGIVYAATQGPEPPLSENFTASVADAQAFDTAINAATRDAQNTRGFTLTFNERQISSWLALEGEQFAEEQGSTFPFKNVQVGLDAGEMIFYGELQLSRIRLPLAVAIKPEVDRAGHLDFEITDADVGGIAAPTFALKVVTGQLEDKLVKPLDDLQGDYVLDPNSLWVQDGVFSVRGQVIY